MEASGVNGKAEDEGAAKKKKKKKWSDEIRVDLSCCKYEVLRIVIQKLGWEEAVDDKPWHLFWTDTSIGPERLMTLRRGQKVNHFLGMLQICRKKSLARHLSNMRRMFPAEYKFFPRSFILPNHIQELITRLNSERLRTYILKPDNGCQGRGVVLVQSVADLKQAIGGMAGANMLAQKYLTNPMMLNGYKFDLRIYALILSCDPLRLFLYREGIARFCTEKYMKPDKGNLKLSCMHLTNYAVNKNNANFEFNSSPTETDKGSKWALTSLFKALAARGYDTGRLKRQIRKMVVMTIIAIVPLLVHNYRNCLNEDDNGRSCFELLGMDVLLDDKCRPWLLEVNHSPSFAIDTPLDFKVKESLLSDTLRLLNIDPLGVSRYRMQDKRGSKMRLYGRRQTSKEDIESPSPKLHNFQDSCIVTPDYDECECKNLGNFDRIYPPDDVNLQTLYSIFLAGSEEAFKQSFDMKVKNAILKAQEERKREEMEKDAAEKKKLKKRLDMRKKAQESARLAALSQRHSSSTTNSVDCNEDPILSGLGKGIIFDMASPQSSVETPTGWERAQCTLDRASERGNLGQQMEEKLTQSQIGYTGILDGIRNHEIATESKTRQVEPEASSPGPLTTQSMKYTPHPYGSSPGIPRLSSLPCIVPQAFGRLQLRKPCFSRASPHDKIPELDSESLFVQRQDMRNKPDIKHSHLSEQKNATFLLARRYYGKLPELRGGPPFPKYGTDPGPFLAEPKSFYSYDRIRMPFRAPNMTGIGRIAIDNVLRAKNGHRGELGDTQKQAKDSTKPGRRAQVPSASGQLSRQKEVRSASGILNAQKQGLNARNISTAGVIASPIKETWPILPLKASVPISRKS